MIDAPAQPPDAAASGPRRRLRLIVSVAGPLAVLVVLAYLLAVHGGQIGNAANRVTAGELVLVTALALLTLLARTEAVVACLGAMGERARRLDIHAANSLTFLAGMVNHYVSSIVRAALLRRIDPVRSPTIAQMMVVDFSTVLIEGLLVTVLIIVSAGTLKLAWWIPAAVVLAGVSAFGLALYVRRRFAQHPVVRGFDVLGHSRQRMRVTALLALVILCQVARTLIVLRAVGLDPSLLQAVATFITAGVLSTLLVGPSAATAGAPLVIFGHSAISAATAAGLVMSATAICAGLLYLLAGGPVFFVLLRQADR